MPAASPKAAVRAQCRSAPPPACQAYRAELWRDDQAICNGSRWRSQLGPASDAVRTCWRRPRGCPWLGPEAGGAGPRMPAARAARVTAAEAAARHGLRHRPDPAAPSARDSVDCCMRTHRLRKGSQTCCRAKTLQVQLARAEGLTSSRFRGSAASTASGPSACMAEPSATCAASARRSPAPCMSGALHRSPMRSSRPWASGAPARPSLTHTMVATAAAGASYHTCSCNLTNSGIRAHMPAYGWPPNTEGLASTSVWLAWQALLARVLVRGPKRPLHRADDALQRQALRRASGTRPAGTRRQVLVHTALHQIDQALRA